MEASPKQASQQPLVVFGVVGLVLTLVLQIAALATTNWLDIPLLDLSVGLFRSCSSKKCGDTDLGAIQDWIDSVRALEILSVILAFAVGFLVKIFIEMHKRGTVRTKRMPLAICCSGLAAGGFGAVGCFIFLGKLATGDDSELLDYLDYSFYMSVSASCFFVVVGFVLYTGTSKLVTLSIALTDAQTAQRHLQTSQPVPAIHVQPPTPQVQSPGERPNFFPSSARIPGQSPSASIAEEEEEEKGSLSS